MESGEEMAPFLYSFFVVSPFEVFVSFKFTYECRVNAYSICM